VLAGPAASWQDTRRDSARLEILAAAWEAAREHGLGSLTLRDVAARVGMRPPSLYWHFDSKMTLYEAMFGQAWAAYNDVQKDMEERLPTSPAGCSGPCELFGEGRTAEPMARLALGAPGGGGPPPFDDLVARDAEDVDPA
jgi:AcrR family transcriptional regulator